MKIISRKKWDEMNQQVVDLQMDLKSAKEDNGTYFMQVDVLRKQNKEIREQLNTVTDNNAGLVSANELLKNKLVDKDKEIRKLKALLTKNKVDYKHLYEKGTKNGK